MGIWACVAVCTSSCGSTGDGDEEPCRTAAPAELSACATTHYFEDGETAVLPECDAQRPVLPIGQRLELKLFRGTNMGHSEVARNTRALQRYFAPHALEFWTAALPEPYHISYAMRGTAPEFERALRDVGIDPSATDLSVEQQAIAADAVSGVMFREARAFLSLHAEPAAIRVNVVVIQQIIAPELVKYLQLEGTVVGLGLSSALIERQQTDPGAPTLNTLFEIDGDFTPTLFVGHTDLRRLTRQSDTIVAHELGHALGLTHAVEPENLMAPAARVDCRGWLSSEQIAMMGPFEAAPAAEYRWREAHDHPPPSAKLAVQDLPRAVVRQVLRRRSVLGGVRPPPSGG